MTTNNISDDCVISPETYKLWEDWDDYVAYCQTKGVFPVGPLASHAFYDCPHYKEMREIPRKPETPPMLEILSGAWGKPL